MGLPVEVNNLMLGSLGGYTVGRSLRFRSSATAYLNRTPASAGSQTTWTWSGWVKRGALGTNMAIFGAYTSSATYYDLQMQSDGTLAHYNATANSTTAYLNTTQVFRDPSAWYHIVAVYNSTDATASNRMKLYVNGVQITAFSVATYPSQNTVATVNSTSAHYISYYGGNPYYFDGYLAEVNFIDGQALTPSSFGAYDTNGVWQPNKYTGTYGTNGFYLPFIDNSATAGFASFYGSFNGSTQYLSISTASPIAFGTSSFTVESWIYPTNFSKEVIIVGGTGTAVGQFGINTNGQLYIDLANTGQIGVSSSGLALNQWQHIAYVRNGTSTKFYINGSDAGGSFTSSHNYAGSTTNIGTTNNNTVNRVVSGYLSNVRVNKTTAVYTANFTAPTSALTAISGTSLLTLQNSTIIDNSTNSYTITNTGSVAMTSATVGSYIIIGNDYSGNGNNWTANNISLTAGTTYDSMIDSPTNAAGNSNGIGNYAVLLPTATNGTVTNGNLTCSSNAQTIWGSMAVSSGKWYWEFTLSALFGTNYAGVYYTLTGGLNPTIGGGWGSEARTYRSSGNKNNGSDSAYGATYTTGDIIGTALDMDAGTITFYKNGVSQGVAFSDLAGQNWYPMFYGQSGGTTTYNVNFGQRPFSYTPPSGYKALNTYNLPAAPISNGAKHFAATTYTGNGDASQTRVISNGNFQPDFVWAKSRSAANSHILEDSVRGSGNILRSELTSSEMTGRTDILNGFSSTGFIVGGDALSNANGTTYIGWQWKGGGTAVTNNSGTISSQVSANTSAGISILTYTGSGANATVGHGLGTVPSFMIIKNRSSGTTDWRVWSSSFSAPTTGYLALNTTAAGANATTMWNSSLPTSSVINLGSSNSVNGSGDNIIAYCFSAVRGFSAFGSYTGNGSSDGPMIYTGFRPRFVMVKRTDNIGYWYIWDTSRNTVNVVGEELYPNASSAGATFSSLDILSNGFKIRSTAPDYNNSGGTVIYAAFAENPFNSSRAR